MPKLLLIFLGFILFISCNRNERSIDPVFPPYKAKVASIIDDMAKDGDVDASVTGYGGVKSEQYKRYEWMLTKATDQALHNLTDHTSPAVRVYAFFALANRKSSLLGKIYEKHKLDTAYFNSQSGCMGLPDRVNKCFRRVIEGRNWFADFGDFDYPPRKYRN